METLRRVLLLGGKWWIKNDADNIRIVSVLTKEKRRRKERGWKRRISEGEVVVANSLIHFIFKSRQSPPFSPLFICPWSLIPTFLVCLYNVFPTIILLGEGGPTWPTVRSKQTLWQFPVILDTRQPDLWLPPHAPQHQKDCIGCSCYANVCQVTSKWQMCSMQFISMSPTRPRWHPAWTWQGRSYAHFTDEVIEVP